MDPIAFRLKDDLYRIDFCGRNSKNQSLIGWVVIDLNDPQKIIESSDEPALGLGELGSFDDNGVTASWLVKNRNKLLENYV